MSEDPSGGGSTWSVLLLDESLPIRPGPLAKVIQKVAGGMTYDHVQRIKSRYGWIAEGIEEDLAADLIEALETEGVKAIGVPDPEIDDLTRIHPLRIHAARLAEDGVHFQATSSGVSETCPWEDLSLVSLGSVPVVRRETFPDMATPVPPWTGLSTAGALVGGMTVGFIPIPIGGSVKTVTVHRDVREDGVLLHLVFARARLVIEIRPKEFNYSYLGERLGKNSRENFLLLLGDLSRFGTGAHWTQMTVTFLETGRLAPDFADEKDFLRYGSWIATIHAATREEPREGPEATAP